ncbi:MAG: hypothetical protein LBC19_16525 [Tannerella sp.]|jgi:hypothetical protein|nr:hypothetical protein [Tannerella sp.]
MKKDIFYMKWIVPVILIAGISTCTSDRNATNENNCWQEDFFYQSSANRPSLEVAYTDSSRTAFEIAAQDYQLVGQLRTPHILAGKNDAKPWLWFEMEDADGIRYSTQNNPENTRINLYRRGPYYCEIHWFDVQLTSGEHQTAPLKGDLALFCYPEKILVDITWHGTGNFEPRRMEVNGLVSLKYDDFKPFEKGTIQHFSFPLYGETVPLPANAFKLLTGINPVRYDKKRGCYIVGTHTAGGFQQKFYDAPNYYETATFTVTNDRQKRKIYICQESSDGGEITEGGIVLDKDGHPMPIVVQVSKNFAGEKEEKFYNPTDIPFSETFFPLYLEPGESHTLTSLHLFQNWGRHMTKHWSSLGAWMDYFHSSTGVTETTCYVPFKFAGPGGVSIADFRAMSQTYFWIGQPQHDNLAGHSFLSYFDGKEWIHTVYQGTTYRSTGPNWYDIDLHYLSADGKVKTTVHIFETPQSDELRSYFDVTYEILKPFVIEDARAHFRFLNVASVIQALRFDRFAATGIEEIRLDPAKKPFPVKGIALPSENFFMAVYGDATNERGSNAIIVKKFAAGSLKPAATVQLGAYREVFKGDAETDTRMCLVADADRLELKAGDKIQIEGYWLPYGATFDTESAVNTVKTDAENAPRITEISIGEKISDLPVKVKACGNEAQFSISGGENLIPVIVTGLTEWRFPRIWIQEGEKWRPLPHSRNNSLDGYQVFCDGDGTFGSVFLMSGSSDIKKLKVTVGKELSPAEKQILAVVQDTAGKSNAIQIGADDTNPVLLQMPSPTLPVAVNDEQVDFKWRQSEGQSLWFTQSFTGWRRGGRLSPNEDDIDLEYWWDNSREGNVHSDPEFSMILSGSVFEGQPLKVLVNDEWKPLTHDLKGPVRAVAVQSAQQDKTLALTFLNTSGVVERNGGFGLRLRATDVPLHKRYHVRGKVYLLDSGLDILKQRILLDLY